MAYRFRPPLWSIVATLLGTGLFLSLGTWQVHRGQDKRSLESAFGGHTGEPVIELSSDTPTPDPLTAPRAQAAGIYDAARQLLLDHQTRNRVPGYHVWTPLRMEEGVWLMVDRGWIAADPDRRRLPDLDVPTEARTIRGHWRPLPEPGLRLASQACEPGAFPRVLSYPTAAELACLLGAPVARGLLLLDPAETEGYVREWELPNPVPPERHYAYAAQWFAFAATLLFLFVKLNLKKHVP
ncbi:MAG: SURF1 family protein [Panacagrimonas sp.]